jgi:hypothetical protein
MVQRLPTRRLRTGLQIWSSPKFAELAARRLLAALSAALSPHSAPEGLLRNGSYETQDTRLSPAKM